MLSLMIPCSNLVALAVALAVAVVAVALVLVAVAVFAVVPFEGCIGEPQSP